MKKKYIAMIVLSTITLLIGSSIYCGICAYPELLEKPGDEKVSELKVETNHEETIIFDYASDDDSGSSVVIDGGHSRSYSVSSDNAEVSSGRSSKKTFINEIVTDFKPVQDSSFDVPTISIEPISETIETKSTSYIFYEHDEANDVSNTKFNVATPKRAFVMATNSDDTPHQAVLETTLLVIGVIDVLSLILLKKKKHKGYQY